MTASIPFSSEDGAPGGSSAETKALAAKLSMLDGRTDTMGGVEQQRSRPTSPGEPVAIPPAPAEPQPPGRRALPSRSRYRWPAPGLATRLIERGRAALKDSLIAAIAAVLAWILAHFLFGHPRPLFAAVTAIVCLAPGLPSHGKQSLGVLLGVFTGIVVGELVLQLPEHTVLLQIPLAAFLAMVMASLYGQAAVVPINAGVSAILVIAMGPTYAGYARLLDVAIGSSVGLLFSQVLMTPNPITLIDRAVQNLLGELSAGFDLCGQALHDRDERRALGAVKRVSAAHDGVIALDTAIASARASARWSIRGQLAARQVASLAARYDRRAIRLYASALLLAESVASALRHQDVPPPGLDDQLAALGRACAAIAAGSAAELPALPAHTDLAEDSGWHSSNQYLSDVRSALEAFERTGTATR